MHELVLLEILAVPAERSRGRHNPRGVKRKMSTFPTKARAAPGPPAQQRFQYRDHIQIVAPPGAEVETRGRPSRCCAKTPQGMPGAGRPPRDLARARQGVAS